MILWLADEEGIPDTVLHGKACFAAAMSCKHDPQAGDKWIWLERATAYVRNREGAHGATYQELREQLARSAAMSFWAAT